MSDITEPTTTPALNDLSAAKARKYANALIYTIRNKDMKYFFISGTVQILSQKLHNHKQDLKKLKEGETLSLLNQLMKMEGTYIELLEPYPCKNKAELDMRVGQWERKINAEENKSSYYETAPPAKHARPDSNSLGYDEHKQSVKARTTDHKNELIQCPLCEQKTKRAKMLAHMIKVHSPPTVTEEPAKKPKKDAKTI